jgi:hypothetical protein
MKNRVAVLSGMDGKWLGFESARLKRENIKRIKFYHEAFSNTKVN